MAKAALLGAVPPIMVASEANPDGVPLEVFDGDRAALAANRAQFFLDVPSGPFSGFNRAGAEVMAERIGAKVTRVSASHAVFMTQPAVVAETIDEAAREAVVPAHRHAAHDRRLRVSGRTRHPPRGRRRPEPRKRHHTREPTINNLYKTYGAATGSGRDGTATVEKGALTLSLSRPKALGGPGGEGANPEQLFASGYAACFLSALRFIAGRQKHKLTEDTRGTVTVGIGPRADGAGFALDIALAASLPGLDPDTAAKLVDGANATCPCAHLTREGAQGRPSVA